MYKSQGPILGMALSVSVSVSVVAFKVPETGALSAEC